MKTNTEKDEEKCLVCKRTLVGVSKQPICPDCINTYGSLVAAIGIGVIGKMALKYGGKIIKFIKF